MSRVWGLIFGGAYFRNFTVICNLYQMEAHTLSNEATL